MQSHLSNHYFQLRYSNSKNRIIPMHHAFKTIHLGSVSRISAIVLPVFFSAVTWLFLPLLLEIWSDITGFWMQHIYNGQVNYVQETLLGQALSIPYPALDAPFPSQVYLWVNLVICVFSFLVSLMMPPRLAALVYVIRTGLLVQGSASIDLLITDFFPYTLPIYFTSALMLSVYMMLLLPLLLGVIYYIFDFSLWKKCLLTLILLAYYTITIPCQYMLHAYLIHEYTLILLPILYILFGTLLDVLAFISIYAIGMSWSSKKQALYGQDRIYRL